MKLVSRNLETSFRRKYALTSRKYALTPRKYALTSQKYALTSRKYFKRILLRDFSTIFGFMAQPPHRGFTLILRETSKILDGPAIRNANRGDSHELNRNANQFAENKYFHDVRAIPCESPHTCDSQGFSAPRRESQKKGVQFGNPQAICENRLIRANLRIDSRESGHLSRRLPSVF